MAAGILACIGLLASWGVLFSLGLSRLQEQHAQAGSYAMFRHALARETAPLGGLIAAGTPVAVLTIPRAHVSGVMVDEGTSAGQLAKGPGHLPTSALPGQAGYAVLFGRSVLYGGPFAHLSSLRAGDPITAVTQQGRFTYRVTGLRTIGDPAPAPPTATAGRLLLVSSTGSGTFGRWAPDRQVIVDADLVGPVAAAPAGRLTNLTPPELAMAGEPSRWPLVAVELQALIIAIAGVLWLSTRWSATRVWVVGGPIVTAALWLVSDSAAQLLPNLL